MTAIGRGDGIGRGPGMAMLPTQVGGKTKRGSAVGVSHCICGKPDIPLGQSGRAEQKTAVAATA